MNLWTHQKKAIENIKNTLINDNKCLVKMFCGTGKTILVFNIMTQCDYNFSVIVFPSISLITQFNEDYINKQEWQKFLKDYKIMSICSKNEINDKNIDYTTDDIEIKNFINGNNKKIISVTYQSLKTFLNVLKRITQMLIWQYMTKHITFQAIY